MLSKNNHLNKKFLNLLNQLVRLYKFSKSERKFFIRTVKQLYEKEGNNWFEFSIDSSKPEKLRLVHGYSLNNENLIIPYFSKRYLKIQKIIKEINGPKSTSFLRFRSLINNITFKKRQIYFGLEKKHNYSPIIKVYFHCKKKDNPKVFLELKTLFSDLNLEKIDFFNKFEFWGVNLTKEKIKDLKLYFHLNSFSPKRILFIFKKFLGKNYDLENLKKFLYYLKNYRKILQKYKYLDIEQEGIYLTFKFSEGRFNLKINQFFPPNFFRENQFFPLVKKNFLQKVKSFLLFFSKICWFENLGVSYQDNGDITVYFTLNLNKN